MKPRSNKPAAGKAGIAVTDISQSPSAKSQQTQPVPIE